MIELYVSYIFLTTEEKTYVYSGSFFVAGRRRPLSFWYDNYVFRT